MIPCEHCGDAVSQLYRVTVGDEPYAVCLYCRDAIKRGAVPAGKLSAAIAHEAAQLIVARYSPFPRTTLQPHAESKASPADPIPTRAAAFISENK